MTCDSCRREIPGIIWHYSGSPVVTCGRCHAEIVTGRGIAETLKDIEKRRAKDGAVQRRMFTPE